MAIEASFCTQLTACPINTVLVSGALTAAHVTSCWDHHGRSASRSNRTPPLLETNRTLYFGAIKLTMRANAGDACRVL